MAHQEEYDKFMNETPPDVLDYMCMSEMVPIEKFVLEHAC
jgi:hypothetical protein